jgi:hypothetical protein
MLIRRIKRAAPSGAFPVGATSNTGSSEIFGPDDCENLQNCWKPAIQLDKEPAIKVREPNATTPAALQDNQLMSQHCILGFKPQLRPEWRGQDGQSEAEQPDHHASLGDSNAVSHKVFGTHSCEPAVEAAC